MERQQEANCDESFEEVDIPEDDYEVLDSNQDKEIAAQRDALMASLKVGTLPSLDGCPSGLNLPSPVASPPLRL